MMQWNWMTYTRILNFDRCFCSPAALLFLFTYLSLNCCAQTKWVPANRACGASLRGLSVVDDSTIWASGSEGTWLRSCNGGKLWHTGTIPGCSKLDFRDVHALDCDRAWVMSAGDTCKIYYTSDAGQSWKLQYINYEPGIFFDGFAFWDQKNALAYSDPIDGRFYIIETTDGSTWHQVDESILPRAIEGEAGFAASGTGICTVGDEAVWIATGGGARARVLHSTDKGLTWTTYDSPLMSNDAAGIFSIIFTTPTNGTIVGGSYLDSTNNTANCATTIDGGVNWKLITEQQPRGYRSCVTASDDGKLLLTVGRTGSEWSRDNGNTWEPIGHKGYFACAIGSRYAWAVGRHGKLGKLDLTQLK